ncbi:hypothetical protein M2375_001832 [Comamonas sp. BIGb0152]|nr:hypothetical protein [Comamonas sp. BIGb0152]
MEMSRIIFYFLNAFILIYIFVVKRAEIFMIFYVIALIPVLLLISSVARSGFSVGQIGLLIYPELCLSILLSCVYFLFENIKKLR